VTAYDPMTTVLSRLDRVKQTGPGQWQALCPAHSDHVPSLSVRLGDDGRVLLRCHATSGCTAATICAALGIEMSDLFPGTSDASDSLASNQARRLAATYAYHDEDGSVLFEVCRYDPKDFRQRHPDGKEGWIWNLNGVRRVLYRLPQISKADPDEWVFIVEGEKDADGLARLGLLATTNPGGAGKWRLEYNEVLKGRDIVILPDNDAPGRKHAAKVAQSLSLVARSVKVVELPGLAEKQDLSDWIRSEHTREELDALVADAELWQPDEGGSTDPEQGASEREGSQAARLVTMVTEAGIEPFHDERGEPYASVPLKEGRQILSLNSRGFENWLCGLAWNQERMAPSSKTLTSTLNILTSMARFDGPEHTLHVRCAWHDGAIWIDLDGRRAVRVALDTWSVTTDPPILFRSFPHQRPLPEPIAAGDPWDVLDFTNLQNEEERLVFLSYLVVGLVPDIPAAALVLHGSQGSAKTTMLRIVKRLLDPSAVDVRGGVRDSNEFAQAAWQNRALFFDNLASVPWWLSDALCGAVTGSGWAKRTLYTDEDTTFFEYRRLVGLAGINLVAERADLLDRSLILELAPVAENDRREEGEFWDAFDEARPQIFGGLLDALARAMAIHPTLELTRLPRMADFARCGAAAAEALGATAGDFLSAYKRNVDRQNEAAIEASPVAQAVIEFMADRESWEGRPGELLEALNRVAATLHINTHARNWPKTPSWMSRRLNEAKPNLMAIGICLSSSVEQRTAERRLIKLTKASGNAVIGVIGVTHDRGREETNDGTCDTTGTNGVTPALWGGAGK